ncbi:hypothetical protein B0H13DRAFT_2552717 [Mycena leptocephala]|nr:hypothetical protein B0H13DRAFT_2552717 [Mycena leptocephala]
MQTPDCVNRRMSTGTSPSLSSYPDFADISSFAPVLDALSAEAFSSCHEYDDTPPHDLSSTLMLLPAAAYAEATMHRCPFAFDGARPSYRLWRSDSPHEESAEVSRVSMPRTRSPPRRFLHQQLTSPTDSTLCPRPRWRPLIPAPSSPRSPCEIRAGPTPPRSSSPSPSSFSPLHWSHDHEPTLGLQYHPVVALPRAGRSCLRPSRGTPRSSSSRLPRLTSTNASCG